jgi:diguanylate cyclase (GGDEF)-like protein
MRQMDILTRYAGDEFVAIMPMASTMMANMIAERIRSATEAKKFTVRTGKTIEVGVSIGVACFPTDGETTEQLFATAVRNMQHDKHARKLLPTLSEPTNASLIDNFR